jgi:hypothetical protein
MPQGVCLIGINTHFEHIAITAGFKLSSSSIEGEAALDVVAVVVN